MRDGELAVETVMLEKGIIMHQSQMETTFKTKQCSVMSVIQYLYFYRQAISGKPHMA
jgi:hypothetical protein